VKLTKFCLWGSFMFVILLLAIWLGVALLHEYLLVKEEQLNINPPGSFIHLPDGRKLFVRCAELQNTNQPLLLLMNGWAADYRLLADIEEQLKENYGNICLYDRAGISFSDSIPHYIEPSLFEKNLDKIMQSSVSDLKNLLNSNIIQTRSSNGIILLPISYGGNIALEFAVKYPEKISAVIALDPPYFPPGTDIGFSQDIGKFMLSFLQLFYESGFIRIFWWLDLMLPITTEDSNELSYWKYLCSRRGGSIAALRAEGYYIAGTDWVNHGEILKQLSGNDSQVPLKMLVHDSWMPGLGEESHNAWKTKSLIQKEILGDSCKYLEGTDHTWALSHPQEYVNWVMESLSAIQSPTLHEE